MQPLEQARSCRASLCAQAESEAAELRRALREGRVLTPEGIKTWRRSVVDRALAIRRLAGPFEGQEVAERIRDEARAVEDLARQLEDPLLRDAEWMAEARRRGGVATPMERAGQAVEAAAPARTFHCGRCGGPKAPSALACAFCGESFEPVAMTATTSGAVGVAGLDLRDEGIAWPDAPQELDAFARDTLQRLRQVFTTVLAREKEGLQLVIDSARAHTQAFEHASDDANERLDRLWRHIREFGLAASDRLSDLDADDLESELDDHAEALLDALAAAQRSMLDDMGRRARLAWDDQRGAGVACTNCGAPLSVPYGFTGEATCSHCRAAIVVGAHQTEHDIAVRRQTDRLLAERGDAKAAFAHWKEQCLSGLTPDRLENLRRAAELLYQEQLTYIADETKRAAAVQRYVDKALEEVGAG